MTKEENSNTISDCKSTKERYTSYHIFYFAFKWKIAGSKHRDFSDETDMSQIRINPDNVWKRVIEAEGEDAVNLYNEKNYFYPFVHKILYDTGEKENLIMHFEHQYPQRSDVRYRIKVKNREQPYDLKVDAINLNIYTTGVGFLSFYLGNEKDSGQDKPSDILNINQYGRRIMPPFFADIVNRTETAEYIELSGMETPLCETFNYTIKDTWKSASFINHLISQLSPNLDFSPLIDDRMFVQTWYINNDHCEKFSGNLNSYLTGSIDYLPYVVNGYNNFWYRFLFIDGESCTCQNDEMRLALLKKSTYPRWENWGSLYGVTRYSMVFLAGDGAPDFLFTTFENIYARMVELVLIQRASMLRFSEEVTQVSHLSHKEIDIISKRISSLYKEYIHFVNQIYFREVTAQDQGIELYDLLQQNLRMEEYVKDLDGEIEELHQYVGLMDDRDRNKKATQLNYLAAFFLPVSIVIGMWGMGDKLWFLEGKDGWLLQVTSLFLAVLFGLSLCVIVNRKRRL